MAFTDTQAKRFRAALTKLEPPERVMERFDSIIAVALDIEHEDRLEDILAEACRLENWTVPWESGDTRLTFRACLIDPGHPEHSSDTASENNPATEQAYRRGMSHGIGTARMMLGLQYGADHPVAVEEVRINKWRRARLQGREPAFWGAVEPEYPCLIRTTLRRSGIRPAIRWNVLTRDGMRCVCCGASASSGAMLEVDHIVPVARGGTDALGNLRTLCFDCNQRVRTNPLRRQCNKTCPNGLDLAKAAEEIKKMMVERVV